jgi:predicted Rossmann fold nucleotide-binding protein DprA/Smf involved in DNA uptake
MSIRTRDFLALTQLRGIGKAKALAIYNFIKTKNLDISKHLQFVDVFYEYSINKLKPLIKPFEEFEIKEAFQIADDIFPVQLRKIMLNGKDESPVTLHYKGDISSTNLPGIVIIGTREESTTQIHL